MRAKAMPGEDPTTLPHPSEIVPHLVEMASPAFERTNVLFEFPTNSYRRMAARLSAMHLIQILLPLYDNEGDALPQGGIPPRVGRAGAPLRRPDRLHARAGGRHLEGERSTRIRRTTRSSIFEVMTETLDRAWWADYRRDLERRFQAGRDRHPRPGDGAALSIAV